MIMTKYKLNSLDLGKNFMALSHSFYSLFVALVHPFALVPKAA